MPSKMRYFEGVPLGRCQGSSDRRAHGKQNVFQNVLSFLNVINTKKEFCDQIVGCLKCYVCAKCAHSKIVVF